LQQPADSETPDNPDEGGPPASPLARWLTLANALTAIRLLAAPACAVAILDGAAVAAAALFALAVVTDLADGPVARRRGEVSALGGLLDHSSDAIFVSLGLAALAFQGQVPALLPLLVILAFFQYVLDSNTLAGHPLRASWLGRWNGIAYFVLLGIPVIRDVLGLAWPGDGWVVALGWGLVASTLVSMGNRALALLRLPTRA
jgi:phosphatidylglycerophosphate synthase